MAFHPPVLLALCACRRLLGAVACPTELSTSWPFHVHRAHRHRRFVWLVLLGCVHDAYGRRLDTNKRADQRHRCSRPLQVLAQSDLPLNAASPGSHQHLGEQPLVLGIGRRFCCAALVGSDLARRAISGSTNLERSICRTKGAFGAGSSDPPEVTGFLAVRFVRGDQICSEPFLIPVLSVAVALLSAAASASAQQTQPTRGIVNITGDFYRAQNNNHFNVFLVTADGIVMTDPINRDFSLWLKSEFRASFRRARPLTCSTVIPTGTTPPAALCSLTRRSSSDTRTCRL